MSQHVVRETWRKENGYIYSKVDFICNVLELKSGKRIGIRTVVFVIAPNSLSFYTSLVSFT